MNVGIKRGTVLVWTFGSLAIASRAMDFQDGNTGQLSVGQQAVSTVLKHYALNPSAINPKTGKPLSAAGQWSLANVTPEVCPQTATASCVKVSYKIPAESVQCTWVVLLNQDGKDRAFLEESEESAQYLLRRVVGEESSSMVISRNKPTYPPIAQAAHVSGTVTVSALVSPMGEMEKATVISGPEMLRTTALDASRLWTFKPLMVGTRSVSYQINLSFTFRTMGPPTGTVFMTP